MAAVESELKEKKRKGFFFWRPSRKKEGSDQPSKLNDYLFLTEYYHAAIPKFASILLQENVKQAHASSAASFKSAALAVNAAKYLATCIDKICYQQADLGHIYWAHRSLQQTYLTMRRERLVLQIFDHIFFPCYQVLQEKNEQLAKNLYDELKIFIDQFNTPTSHDAPFHKTNFMEKMPKILKKMLSIAQGQNNEFSDEIPTVEKKYRKSLEKALKSIEETNQRLNNIMAELAKYSWLKKSNNLDELSNKLKPTQTKKIEDIAHQYVMSSTDFANDVLPMLIGKDIFDRLPKSDQLKHANAFYLNLATLIRDEIVKTETELNHINEAAFSTDFEYWSEQKYREMEARHNQLDELLRANLSPLVLLFHGHKPTEALGSHAAAKDHYQEIKTDLAQLESFLQNVEKLLLAEETNEAQNHKLAAQEYVTNLKNAQQELESYHDLKQQIDEQKQCILNLKAPRENRLKQLKNLMTIPEKLEDYLLKSPEVYFSKRATKKFIEHHQHKNEHDAYEDFLEDLLHSSADTEIINKCLIKGGIGEANLQTISASSSSSSQGDDSDADELTLYDGYSPRTPRAGR